MISVCVPRRHGAGRGSSGANGGAEGQRRPERRTTGAGTEATVTGRRRPQRPHPSVQTSAAAGAGAARVERCDEAHDERRCDRHAHPRAPGRRHGRHQARCWPTKTPEDRAPDPRGRFLSTLGESSGQFSSEAKRGTTPVRNDQGTLASLRCHRSPAGRTASGSVDRVRARLECYRTR